MKIETGIFLESSATLEDPNFQRVIIFITEYDDTGATGFVINKPYGRTLNELQQFEKSPAIPLYEGGPAETGKLYFIHRQNENIKDGTPVKENIFVGGSFDEVLTRLDNHSLTTADIKIFIGYCGWDPGQLEAEIEEGSWIIKEENPDIIFQSF